MWYWLWNLREFAELEEYYRLGNENRVFQAEILKAAAILLYKGVRDKSITIFADSQAAIQAVESRQINSKVVLDCREAYYKGCATPIGQCYADYRGIKGMKVTKKLII